MVSRCFIIHIILKVLFETEERFQSISCFTIIRSFYIVLGMTSSREDKWENVTKPVVT